VVYKRVLGEGDGIEVTFLWDGFGDRVLVNVRDRRAGEWLLAAVDGAGALDAFRHSFAYAAHRAGVPAGTRAVFSGQ
jgi:hypothetical protein